MEWQPIESVPSGVSKILGFSGVWNDEPEIAVYERVVFGGYETWEVFGDQNDYYSSPTHWMPLPEPPK